MFLSNPSQEEYSADRTKLYGRIIKKAKTAKTMLTRSE